MLRTKKADRIVCIATVVMLLAAALLWGVVEPAQGDGSHAVGYENLLFDQSKVHTIDITMDGWDDFIANATAEEYTECNIAVDGEKFNNVAIRGKGNTSLSSVSALNSTRYSFKIEFDHYVKGMTYHGLDKLSLNNLIQDATMMKDYLAYTLMDRMDVPAPLCSYVQINVNGEPWGLYLAVEGVEDAFMERNGMTKGELYKPDSLSFGGGRGNGRDFDLEQFRVQDDDTDATAAPGAESTPAPDTSVPSENNPFGSFGGFGGGMPQGDFSSFGGGQMPQGDFDFSSFSGGQMPQGDFDFSSFSGGQMPQGDFTLPDGTGSETPDTANSEETGTGETVTGEKRERRGFGGGQEGGFGGGFGGFNFGMGSDDVKLVYSDDDPDSYSNIFNNAKTDVSEKDKTRLIEALRKLNAREDLDSVVNKNEVINYLAVHDFLCNSDSYTGMMVHNYYLYEEKGKLSIIPWDYNLGFGGFSASADATSTVNSPIDSPVNSGTVDSRPLIAWIFSDEDALAAYHEAYDRFISETIESGWLEAEISRVKEMITPYLEKDESAFYDMETFEKAVDTLQTFCLKRGESVRGQLDGTIPSTSNGQRGSDALIDASDISTADMGSMSSGGGGGGFGGGGFGGGGIPSEMPSGMPDFSSQGGGFSMPEGFSFPDGFSSTGGFTLPEGFSSADGFPQMSGQDDNGSFGGSAQTSDTPAPRETQPAQQTENTDATDAPADTAAPSRDSGRQDRPSGFPGGGDFFGPQQTDQTGLWVQAAVCAAVLLAAILIVWKIKAHNG